MDAYPKRAAVIVAGGSGSRMGTEIPKQFLDLKGKPVLYYAIERFYRFDPAMYVVLVLPDNQLMRWKEWQSLIPLLQKVHVASGGKSRTESVSNGLSQLPANIELVAVHDAVRPLLSIRLIESCFAAAAQIGAAIPAVPLLDSIRVLEGDHSVSVDRSLYRAVQTPQCFQLKLLVEAYKAIDTDRKYTDDASVVEAYGSRAMLVEGEQDNFKITFPSDLLLAEQLLSF